MASFTFVGVLSTPAATLSVCHSENWYALRVTWIIRVGLGHPRGGVPSQDGCMLTRVNRLGFTKNSACVVCVAFWYWTAATMVALDVFVWMLLL